MTSFVDPGRRTHLLFSDKQGIYRVNIENVTSFESDSTVEQVLPLKDVDSLDFNYEENELCYVRVSCALYTVHIRKLKKAYGLQHLFEMVLFLFLVEKQLNAMLQHVKHIADGWNKVHFFAQT